MKCISCPSPALSIDVHRYKNRIWPANKPPTLQVNGNSRLLLLSSRALPLPIFLAAAAAAAAAAPPAPKLSVLLQTGAVCLIMYWVANFVVPGFILKDLQSKDTNENREEQDQD